MPTYATQAEFEAYTALRPTVGTVNNLLEKAERYIDQALGRYARVDTTTGLKLNPAVLLDYQQTALSNATCAQAVYMIAKGETFFIEQIPTDPTGPDGGYKGRETVLAPEADRELTYGQLYNLSGGKDYPFPNQNWRDYVP